MEPFIKDMINLLVYIDNDKVQDWDKNDHNNKKVVNFINQNN